MTRLMMTRLVYKIVKGYTERYAGTYTEAEAIFNELVATDIPPFIYTRIYFQIDEQPYQLLRISTEF